MGAGQGVPTQVDQSQGMAQEPSVPRTRRQVLTAAVVAAGGALAARTLGVPEPVEAANGSTVKVGQSNSGTATTTVRNTAASSSAVALKGVVTRTGSGSGTAGVFGQSAAQNGRGVVGYATRTGSDTKGVYGRSVNGRGVHGRATGTTGANYGVYGESMSSGGTGVYGKGGNRGIHGTGITGMRGDGTSIGIYGEGANYGIAGSSPGVAVYGSSTEYGVYGNSAGTGVYGSGNDYGVRGFGETHGVFGNGTTYGVRGSSANWAGYFTGKVHVAGVLTKSSGTFLIDHPLDPANKTLSHSFVEAPEMLNIYRGAATLNGRGRATVRLPRYYEALNRDHHVQLTAVGEPAPSLHVAREVVDGRFTIGGGVPGQRVFWIVTGVRQDAWARKHPLRVERTKPRKDRGKYLNPEVHGHGRQGAIHPLPRTPRRRRLDVDADPSRR